MSISFKGYSMGSSSRWPENLDEQKIDGSNSVFFGGGVRTGGSGDNDDSEDSDKAGEGTLDEGA